MLQAGDPMAAQLGFYGAVALATFKALVAIGLFGMVAIGFLFTRLTLAERVVALGRGAVPARRFPVTAIPPVSRWRPPSCSGNGGSVRATRWRRLEPLSRLRRRRQDAVACGLHAGLDPFDRKDRLAGRLAHHATGLELVQARVKGSGAGMEPPPEARLVDGWFQWRPKRAPMPEVVLGNSGAAGEWRLCADGQCRTLSDIFGHPIGANVTTMRVCER